MKRLNQWCLSNFSSAKFLLFPSTLGRSFGAVCACRFTPHSFIRAFISFFISVRILGFVFYLSVYAIYFAAQLVSDLASERFFVFLVFSWPSPAIGHLSKRLWFLLLFEKNT